MLSAPNLSGRKSPGRPAEELRACGKGPDDRRRRSGHAEKSRTTVRGKSARAEKSRTTIRGKPTRVEKLRTTVRGESGRTKTHGRPFTEAQPDGTVRYELGLRLSPHGLRKAPLHRRDRLDRCGDAPPTRVGETSATDIDKPLRAPGFGAGSLDSNMQTRLAVVQDGES